MTDYDGTDNKNIKRVDLKEEKETENKMHGGGIGPVLGERMQTIYEYGEEKKPEYSPVSSTPMDRNVVMSFEDLDAYEKLMERKGQVIKRADQLKMMVESANDDNTLKGIIKGCMDRLKGMYSEYDARYNGEEVKSKSKEDHNPKESHDKQEYKTEDGVKYPASDFAYVPDPDMPSTWKLRLAEDKPGNITREQLGRAAAAFSPGGFRGNRVEIPSDDVNEVKKRIRDEYKRLDVPDDEIPKSVKEKKIKENSQNKFILWKEASGRYRWLAVYSNKFRDNDNPPEIISEKAHQTFVDLIDKGKAPYPELWLWHIPGTRWGEADYIAYDNNGFAIASGLIDEGKEHIAKNIANSDMDWLTSHGMPVPFIKRDKEDPTIIEQYITSEISPLPATAAANKLTGFTILPEEVKGMSLPDNKRQVLADIGFNVDELEQDLEDKAKSAHEQNIEFKEGASEKQEDEMSNKQETVSMKELEEFKQQILEAVKGKVEQEQQTDYVSKNEMQELVTEMANSIKGLSDKVDTIIQGKQAEEAKEKEETPAASNLATLFKSAIGSDEAVVDGRTKLGSSEPELPEKLKNAGQHPNTWSLNQLFAPVKEYNTQNGAQ